MTTMYVTYAGNAADRFDREYYVSSHLPLVMECWGPYGLLSCGAFFPYGDGAGTVAIAECKFRDDAALASALAAPETAKVMADVARFTAAKPVQRVADAATKA